MFRCVAMLFMLSLNSFAFAADKFAVETIEYSGIFLDGPIANTNPTELIIMMAIMLLSFLIWRMIYKNLLVIFLGMILAGLVSFLF